MEAKLGVLYKHKNSNSFVILISKKGDGYKYLHIHCLSKLIWKGTVPYMPLTYEEL